MIVYRYLSEQYGLLALQQRKWKIGRLLELNDPMDCQPKLQRSNGQTVSIGSDPYFRDIFNSVGIICYSESINDPVIWSHYADTHRGMALGLEFPNQDELLKVEYPLHDERPVLDYETITALNQTNQDGALLQVIVNGFRRKAKSWAYESEHRQFIYLVHCTMQGPHYFRDIPVPHLKRVVLGAKARVTESDIAGIIRSWQTKYPVDIKKAKMDPDKFRVVD